MTGKLREAKMTTRGSGAKLWERAKKVIPGGNQLLSKRAERFLPGLWPSFYSRARGCEVWDCENNHYLDFAQMGVGSCVLGYADPDVNKAVTNAIADGSMSSLNCFEEIELAERLIQLHPWSDMARFSRSGGEACSIAVRIARAATGRSKVAFCGYHGWHDWYLAANISDQRNLDGQLLPGLAPRGVPRELAGTALPFNFNCIYELEAVVAAHGNSIAAIVMEPMRDKEPEPGFLEGVRKLADQAGAVLIFDEVTSGFRVNFGGIHKIFGINPDIAIFGKALGNGFPISAVIGRRAIMESAQDTFISSTFWTERTGFAAALATLAKYERESVHEHLVHYGERISAGWASLSARFDVRTHISGIPPLTHLSFADEEPMVLQTLYAQEMLKRGYLLGSAVYSTFAYSDAIIDEFIEQSGGVFKIISDAASKGNARLLLQGDPIQIGFKRLT
jgi:glutamate-1-semialdehyde aminotransferase